MEFDEHEDQEEEMEMPPPVYQKLGSTGGGGEGGGGGEDGSATRKSSIRYKECQKNHAVHISGHAVDGCLEFMAAGEEGTLDALKCAACNCHRNFHRKETDRGGNSGGGYGPHHLPPQSISPYNYRAPTPSGYLHLTPPTHRPPPMTLVPSEEDVSNPSSSGGGGGGGSSKKRFRTKFTQEQKDKMLELAERIGWRIQKHDESVVEQFCAETGVKRQVFKVWMHNNKSTLAIVAMSEFEPYYDTARAAVIAVSEFELCSCRFCAS